MTEELLKQIAKNTSPKESYQIVVSSNQNDFDTLFNPNITLDRNKRYEIALVNLETYYSFPNIDSSNNVLNYSKDSGATWKTITIPEGSYEITDINIAVQTAMKLNGDWDSANSKYYITIGANLNTLKSTLEITNTTYRVDFNVASSISSVLGFNKQVYSASYQESENVVNILSINSILVNIDIISGSFLKGTRAPVIYSFFPSVSPGYKIIENPVNLVYLPVELKQIHRLRTSITDQDGKLLNLRNETLIIRFHLRQA